ncbi:MAG: hypothetical protein P8L66_06660 [Rhodospirillaceae bacterium]|nr:hypothetical protein [Rhodospirillaceae bacterium]
MTETDPKPSADPKHQSVKNGEDVSALRVMQRDIQQKIYRRHIIRQIGNTVQTPSTSQDDSDEPTDDSDTLFLVC